MAFPKDTQNYIISILFILVSMDELANQHTNGNGPKYSLYQNPQEYEHRK